MPKIQSYYDNLMVARNAPPRVIKAAYKALCQTYHPDKYQGGRDEAERIMKIINAAYAVLSDPVKKAQHDAWLAAHETIGGNADGNGYPFRRRAEADRKTAPLDPQQDSRNQILRPALPLLGLVLLLLGFWLGAESLNAPDEARLPEVQAKPATGDEDYAESFSTENATGRQSLDPGGTVTLPPQALLRQHPENGAVAPKASGPQWGLRGTEPQAGSAKRFEPSDADAADAVEFETWARQGNAYAQYALGMMHFRKRDYSQALFWCRKAADQDYVVAQNQLGDMYGQGQGVAQDDRQAFYWRRKAAQQGYAPAQYQLGLMYAQQQGVARDYNKAVYWWNKAAQQGYAEAVQLLGNRDQSQVKFKYPGNSAAAAMPPECVIKPVMSDEELKRCAK